MSGKAGKQVQLLTQQQLQELSGRYQQLQSQAEAISQQANMLQITIRDVETALTTVTALKDETAGKETLVPIGFGSFVNATLTSPDKIVVGIGAGVSVEKSVDDAKGLLDKRKEELTKYHDKLNETLTKLGQELQNIQKIMQQQAQLYQAQQSSQPRQQPMHAE
jgi:prefoldin alpha subunit